MEQMAGAPPVYGKLEPVYASASGAGVTSTCPVVPDRPARVQSEQKRQLQQVEHSGEYNIWYGRYAGEHGYEKAPRASTRVCIETDAGLTRADYTSNSAHLCLHFARGCCAYGKDCTFRHCAPTEEDESQADSSHDVFGRNRHASFREDMGGTGSWDKECKTLYVGRICATPPEAQMTETVTRHFGEFGPIDSVRVLKNKGVAFVTYRLRATAEFAKEAMGEQALDHDEQINVRWAHDDPNPRAQATRLRNDAQLMLAAMEARGHLPSAVEDPYPEDGLLEPDAKRHRGDGDGPVGPMVPMTREEHASLQAQEEAAAEAAAAEAAAAAAAAARNAELEQAASTASRLDQILNSIDGQGGALDSNVEAKGVGARSAASTSGNLPSAGADPLHTFLQSMEACTAPVDAADSQAAPTMSRDAAAELPPGIYQSRGLPPGWQEYSDPHTGYPFYVSPQGESTWARPAS